MRAADSLGTFGEYFALDRGFLNPVNHLVPPPAAIESFHWEVEPGGCYIQCTVYIDGSQLDGPYDLFRRCGWPFVAIDDDGRVTVAAYGVPPPPMD